MSDIYCRKQMGEIFSDSAFLYIDFPPEMYDEELFNLSFNWDSFRDAVTRTYGVQHGSGIEASPTHYGNTISGFPDIEFKNWEQKYEFGSVINISFAMDGTIYNMGTNRQEFFILNFGGTWGKSAEIENGIEPISITLQSFNNRLSFNIFDRDGTRHYWDTIPISTILDGFTHLITFELKEGTSKVWNGTNLYAEYTGNSFEIMPRIGSREPRLFIVPNDDYSKGTINIHFDYLRFSKGTVDSDRLSRELERLGGFYSKNFTFNSISETLNFDSSFQKVQSLTARVQKDNDLISILSNRDVLDSKVIVYRKGIDPDGNLIFWRTFIGFVDSIRVSNEYIEFNLIHWLKKLSEVTSRPVFAPSTIGINPWNFEDNGTITGMSNGTVLFYYYSEPRWKPRRYSGIPGRRTGFDEYLSWEQHRKRVWEMEDGYLGSVLKQGQLITFAEKDKTIKDLNEDPPDLYFSVVSFSYSTVTYIGTIILDQDTTFYGISKDTHKMWLVYPRVFSGDAVSVFKQLITDSSVSFTRFSESMIGDSFKKGCGIRVNFSLQPFQKISESLKDLMNEGMFSIYSEDDGILQIADFFPYPGTVFKLPNPIGDVEIIQSKRIDGVRLESSIMNDGILRTFGLVGLNGGGNKVATVSSKIVSDFPSAMNMGYKKLFLWRDFTKKYSIKVPLGETFYLYPGNYVTFDSDLVPLSDGKGTYLVESIEKDFSAPSHNLEVYNISDLQHEGKFGIFQYEGTSPGDIESEIPNHSFDQFDDSRDYSEKYYPWVVDYGYVGSRSNMGVFGGYAGKFGVGTSGSFLIYQIGIDSSKFVNRNQFSFYIWPEKSSYMYGTLKFEDSVNGFVTTGSFSGSLEGSKYNLISINFDEWIYATVSIKLNFNQETNFFLDEIRMDPNTYQTSGFTVDLPEAPNTHLSSFRPIRSSVHAFLLADHGTSISFSRVLGDRGFAGKIYQIDDELIRLIETEGSHQSEVRVERGVFDTIQGTHGFFSFIWNLKYYSGGELHDLNEFNSGTWTPFNFW